MTTLFGGNIHAGISGIELDESSFDLGEGIKLSKAYAHLMAPFMMASTPAPIGKPHPATCKAARGVDSFDVNAELFLPAAIDKKFGSRIEVARTVLFLLRLGVNPAV